MKKGKPAGLVIAASLGLSASPLSATGGTYYVFSGLWNGNHYGWARADFDTTGFGDTEWQGGLVER